MACVMMVHSRAFMHQIEMIFRGRKGIKDDDCWVTNTEN